MDLLTIFANGRSSIAQQPVRARMKWRGGDSVERLDAGMGGNGWIHNFGRGISR